MNRRESRRQTKEAQGTIKGKNKGGKAASHCFKGEQLAREGKIDEAIQAFRQAISVDPGYAAAHYNLGNFLRSQVFINEAETVYRQILDIKPDFAEAHANLGNALKELGRLEDAVAGY
jgi:tetratricopeptide (TPR) repeat protein